jgi:ADP-ribose pyrophosphatase YjhB (NUDIX family)
MGRLWYFAQAVLGLVFRHPVLGTSIIPILADGRIVLIRKQKAKKWSLPGGMVAWREDIATTVTRELKEETGLDLVCLKRLVGIYSDPDRDPRIHSVCVVVEATVEGTVNIQDAYEVAEVRAFLPEALPWDHLSHDYHQQLSNYLQNLTTLA